MLYQISDFGERHMVKFSACFGHVIAAKNCFRTVNFRHLSQICLAILNRADAFGDCLGKSIGATGHAMK